MGRYDYDFGLAEQQQWPGDNLEWEQVEIESGRGRPIYYRRGRKRSKDLTAAAYATSASGGGGGGGGYHHRRYSQSQSGGNYITHTARPPRAHSRYRERDFRDRDTSVVRHLDLSRLKPHPLQPKYIDLPVDVVDVDRSWTPEDRHGSRGVVDFDVYKYNPMAPSVPLIFHDDMSQLDRDMVDVAVGVRKLEVSRSGRDRDRAERRGSRGVADVAIRPSFSTTSYKRPPPLPRVTNQSRYTEAHVLVLQWEFHDLAGCFNEVTGDFIRGLEEEALRLRDTFESYGYQVHDARVPMGDPVEYLERKLRKFLARARDDVLLIVYYHGHGGLNENSELCFTSHEHPGDPLWSQMAAAELYEAVVNRDSWPKHERASRFQELTKKFERFRPIASLPWAAIRDPLMEAPCDLLLILDCCAAGGANLRSVDWQPPSRWSRPYTKHLFAACGFESSTRDDMTAALCDVLDDHAADPIGAPITTKRLHQVMEDRLQKTAVGSQPIFKQLLPRDPEKHITLPRFRDPWRAPYG